MTNVVLQQRDCDVLQALREDRAECGQGLSLGDLERIGATRWVHRTIRRLNEAGHWIASSGSTDETRRWQLLDPLPSTEALDDGRSPAAPPAAVDRPSSASVEGRLFELAPTPHYAADREAA